MMKPRFTKHLCMLLTLLLLLAPAAAFAEGESPIKIGDKPTCRVTMPNVSLDTGGELYLNGISYEAQLNLKGDIVVRNVDLTAAKRAAEAIADYETQHNSEKFTATANMKIISGYGLKVLRSELPDLKNAATEIESMEFPEELSDDSTQRLAQALTALEQNLSTKGDENYSDNIRSILQLFNVSDASFNENMTDVYLLLYDIRAAIACGTLPQSILTEETTTNLLAIFRDILEKGGVDLDEIEFWESDEDWVAYAAKESKSKLAAGDKIVISDKAGKSITFLVNSVFTVPAVPEPPSPDEYAYEAPSPPGPPHIETPAETKEFTIESETAEQGGVVKFEVNDECQIHFSVDDAREEAIFDWQCTVLPDYLEFAVNNDDSSKASITGKPNTVGVTYVTVSAISRNTDIHYIGSLSFTIEVIKAISEGLTGVSAPQLLTTSTAPLPTDTSDATDPSTLSNPSTLTTPTDTAGTTDTDDYVDPTDPTDTTDTTDTTDATDTAGTTGTTDTDDYVDTTDTTDPATPTDPVDTTEPVDPESPELPES